MGIQPKKEGKIQITKPRKKTASGKKRKPRSDKGKKRGKKAK